MLARDHPRTINQLITIWGVALWIMLKLTWYTGLNAYVGETKDITMAKHKNKSAESRPVKLLFLGLVGFALVLWVLLKGTDIALLNPKGLIAGEQYSLLLLSTAVLFGVAVPTLFLFYYFAWKYRETNDKAAYDPATRHGKASLIIWWAIPSVVFVVLSVVMWSATHRLEPKKPIVADKETITIQVVAMRWKWLFIYPEQKIATVNFVQIPKDTPVQFQLTADEAPMSSFWIPHLSGQLYAMTGHVNRLNLMADAPGDYPGSSAEINGAGFAGMKFIARVSSEEVYNSWVKDVQVNSAVLGSSEYQQLVRPSENNLVAFYQLADENLYDKVVMKYMASHDHHTNSQHTEHE
jgi:cytochrome o ubiquinol oxidase subunit 2